MGNQQHQINNEREPIQPPKTKIEQSETENNATDSQLSETSVNTGQLSESNEINKQSDTASQAPSSSSSANGMKYTITWNEGGDHIEINGDFFNWKGFYPLSLNKETGKYYITILARKKLHEFVFRVDGNIKCSKDYPVKVDMNNQSINYIEISFDDNNSIKSTKKQKIKYPIINPKKIKNTNDYNNFHPKRGEMNHDAPRLPFQYTSQFDIDVNSRQNDLYLNAKKVKFMEYKENNLLSENNSYKKLLICPHINLYILYNI